MTKLNLEEALDKLKEDRDVVEPFVRRLFQRVQERFPDEHLRLSDISLKVEVNVPSGTGQIHRMLTEMINEGVTF